MLFLALSFALRAEEGVAPRKLGQRFFGFSHLVGLYEVVVLLCMFLSFLLKLGFSHVPDKIKLVVCQSWKVAHVFANQSIEKKRISIRCGCLVSVACHG